VICVQLAQFLVLAASTVQFTNAGSVIHSLHLNLTTSKQYSFLFYILVKSTLQLVVN